MRYSFILPDWIKEENKNLTWAFEKEDFEISKEEVEKLNRQGYNVYYYPNYSSSTVTNRHLKGSDIDVFEWLFIDMDLKDKKYDKKQTFVKFVETFSIKPTKIVDSGHGVHVYWRVSDLNAEKYLNLQKRLIQHFNTDPSIFTLKQLMRLEGYCNTKVKKEFLVEDKKRVMCKFAGCNDKEAYTRIYTTTDFDLVLPKITEENQKIITQHLKTVYEIADDSKKDVDTTILPERFAVLLKQNKKIHDIFYTPQSDNSKSDYYLSCILKEHNFTEEEAYIVLHNTEKGQKRGHEYVVRTLRAGYDNTDSIGDVDYEQVQKIMSKEEIIRQEEDEIKEYKRKKSLQEVREAKYEEKLQGVFSLKNTADIWLSHYKESIKQLDKSMKNRLPCMTEEVSKVMPLEGVEMLLFGALTGQGKSTIAANMAVPILAENRRILYLSTEERAEDILIRVAALQNGWNPNNQRDWNQETKLKRDLAVEQLVRDGKLLIVDSYSPGVDEQTGQPIKPADLSMLEDFKLVLNSVVRDELKFDLLIVDYISKVGMARRKNENVEWKVISEATKFVEEWCKSAQTPAIVFTQLKNKETDTQEFKMRLPGSKRILDYVTCAVEIATDYDAKTTKLICHKNRKYGKLFRKTLKFDKGKFVDQTDFDDTE